MVLPTSRQQILLSFHRLGIPIDELGGLPTLFNMTKFFYRNAFRDATLDKFIRDHDDPHAMRFAKWIHQKLTDSNVWDNDRASRSQSPVAVGRG